MAQAVYSDSGLVAFLPAPGATPFSAPVGALDTDGDTPGAAGEPAPPTLDRRRLADPAPSIFGVPVNFMLTAEGVPPRIAAAVRSYLNAPTASMEADILHFIEDNCAIYESGTVKCAGISVGAGVFKSPADGSNLALLLGVGLGGGAVLLLLIYYVARNMCPPTGHMPHPVQNFALTARSGTVRSGTARSGALSPSALSLKVVE